MKLAWITSNFLSKGYREIKTRITQRLIETSKASYPFGFDASPSKNYMAIVADTQSNQEPVIIGYLNPNAITDLNVGDSSIFSTNSEGEIQATIKMRNDGTCEIIGSDNNAVQYQALESAISNFNDALKEELVLIQTGITGAGGSYTPTNPQLDISASKIESIKVP